MKVALCLFGYVGSEPSNNRMIVSDHIIQNYKSTILNKYDCDVFIHSWSKTSEPVLIREFQPKKYIFEDQIEFNDISINQYKLSNINSYASFFKTQNDPFELIKDLIPKSNSRWYSNCRSIELLKNFSEENNIKYDLVLQLRLDCFFYSYLKLEDLDNNFFYSSERTHEKNIAINDLYFISNYKNAMIFQKIYENLFLYSVRPVIAAKQHLEINAINQKDHKFYQGIDFNLYRDHLSFIEQQKKISQKIKNFIKKIIGYSRKKN